MSPGLRPLDYVLVRAQLGCHTGEGVHGGHGGVKVELHPLLRSGVLPGLALGNIDVVGVQLDVLTVPGGLHLPLDAQPHAGLHGALQRLGLPSGEIFLHRHGTCVVRHVKAEAPHTGPAGLPALKRKDLPCHRGVVHF